MKLNILVVTAHPDDAEMGCGGTIIKHCLQNQRVGLIDLTQGELGTRGTPQLRLREAEEAAKRMGAAVRENMGFRDGFFQNDEAHQKAIIRKIRYYQPDIIITNAPKDRHPDHSRASELVSRSAWLSGLERIETKLNGRVQDKWRPSQILHIIQFKYLEPDFVVDIEDVVDQKMEAIKAYQSQFYDPESNEPDTILSNSHFFETLKSRWREMGAAAHIQFAEGFLCERKPALDNLNPLKLKGKA